MAVTEERRHRLFTKLERLIGEEDATTMMELVPPVGWGEVATKRDLDNLAVATKREFENAALTTTAAIDKLRTEWSRQAMAMIISIVTANTAMTALIVSVAKLGG